MALYICILGLSTFRLYSKPIYTMDSIQYMGNALLMEDRDIVSVHNRVYAEINRFVPEGPRRMLLGDEPGAPADQTISRRMRAQSPLIYAQFLPFFAIRPLYNQTIWLVSKLGFGLVRSTILISAGSYFGMGILLCIWITRHVNTLWGFAIAILAMISPPLCELGRNQTSDPLSTLVAFLGIFLIFETNRLAAGLTVLLASIYFRTDYVALVGPVVLLLWLQKRLDFWKAAVLSLLAVGSVLAINHFAGDYGIRMLYYRNFVGVPVEPAQMTIQFSSRDYLAAFRSGITLVANSFFLPFLLVGVIGTRQIKMRGLFAVSLAYVILHFIILPNWQERWVGIFYLCCAISASSVLAISPTNDVSPGLEI